MEPRNFPVCQQPGCERSTKRGSRGYCTMHYQRLMAGRRMDVPKNTMPGHDRTCDVPGCDRPHLALGFCSAHYNRHKAGKPMDAPMRSTAAHPRTCTYKGCSLPHFGLGFCKSHYYRQHEGRPMDAPLKEWAAVGTRRVSTEGYILLKVRSGGKRSRVNWMPEHRHVMQQHIGRALQPHESVHHKNGDRTDNGIENLELWSRSHLPGQRVADRVQWAREILAEYGDLVDRMML